MTNFPLALEILFVRVCIYRHGQFLEDIRISSLVEWWSAVHFSLRCAWCFCSFRWLSYEGWCSSGRISVALLVRSRLGCWSRISIDGRTRWSLDRSSKFEESRSDVATNAATWRNASSTASLPRIPPSAASSADRELTAPSPFSLAYGNKSTPAWFSSLVYFEFQLGKKDRLPIELSKLLSKKYTHQEKEERESSTSV